MLKTCLICGWNGSEKKVIRHCYFGGLPVLDCLGHCPECYNIQPHAGHCEADRLGIKNSSWYGKLDFAVALA